MSAEIENLKCLFEKVLNRSNEKDRHVLSDLLNGVLKKQNNETRTYINGVLDYKGKRIGDKSYRAEITLQPFADNPLEILHGGMTATFADTAMGTLVNHVLDNDHTSVTSELKMNYLKPAKGEKLFCEATVVHQGKSLCFVTATLISDQGNTVAFATGSFFIIPVPTGMQKTVNAKE